MTDETIFATALEKADPAERAAFLADACRGNAEQRGRLEGLLLAHAGASRFLERRAGGLDSGDTPTLAHEAGAPDEDEVPLGFLAPATRPDSIGRIGHYEVLQVLGKGGFGIVFRAFDEILHRVVAVKVLSPQMAATSPARKRFLREARSSAQVRHENVVQVYEVGEQPLPYIAMEFIPGETLQQRLDRTGPVEVADILRIGRQIAEGLAAAHATDLIHRDIKPGNVLLEGGAQRVKITDFGLARAADDASISQSGIIAGTPMFMAPEQARGETLDQRADLFSLGSVLYQMAAGRPPFRANGTLAVLKRVAEDTPRPIREVIPETPQWLCDIIAKLHAKNPDDRFQSAREVADVLADCEGQLEANAKLKDYSRIPRSKPRRSGRWKWVAAAAAVLLLPMIALAVMEFAGVTHLFRAQQATHDPIKPLGDLTPVSVTQQEALPPTFKNRIGMEFVIVPKGKSWLGGGKDRPGDKEVTIPADFYLGKYEVTQEEWVKEMGENPSYFSRTGGGNDAVKDISDADLKRFPLENVSWDQCQVYVAKLNEREKEAGWVYRLPKLEEWEYACRGGPMSNRLDSAFHFYLAKPTNTLLPDQANFNAGLNRTCKVGSYQPNRLGLFDLHGNGQEWCDDSEQANTNSGKRLRGGSFRIGRCEAAGIAGAESTFRGDDLGLRLARVPSGAPAPEAKTPPPVGAPFTDAEVQRIAALPAAERVEEVRKELMRRNPGFDGKVGHKIEGDALTEFAFNTDQIFDIAPVRALTGLVYLDLRGTYPNKGKLADLSPLEGMKLSRLDCSSTQIANLGPLTGVPLTTLHVNHNPVADLTPIKGMKLERLGIAETKVTDLTPLKGMKLKNLGAQLLPVTDLSPLEGMPLTGLDLYHTVGVTKLDALEGMPLEALNLQEVPVKNLAPLKGMSTLRSLQLVATDVSDLSPLAGLELTDLILGGNQITDLTPLKGLPLKRLHFYGTGVRDLRPLQGMSLDDIRFNPKNITQGLDVLRDMKSLKTIGVGGDKSWPAAEFWERYDKGEFKVGFAPFTDADVKRIAALPAEQQVEEVRKELVRRNPDFDGKVMHKIEDGVVTEIQINADQVKDISPIRVFNALRVLVCGGVLRDFRGKINFADLSALKGMNLADLTELHLNWTRVDDAGMILFKECKKLKVLNLYKTQVGDVGLSHFKKCNNLTKIILGMTAVSDVGLAHFKDCKNLTHIELPHARRVSDVGVAHFKDCSGLEFLDLAGTRVGDATLAQIKDKHGRLTFLNLDGTPISDAGLAHLRACKELNTLFLHNTKVTDAGLAHVKDYKNLTFLHLNNTKVTDLALLKGLPLKEINCDFNPKRDSEILRSMITLEKINNKPAQAFWKDVERK